ncbi:MAG: hypothetical protein LBF59_03825 [Prevotellaceae bacterium]|jgi:hypothetical protein|nr:hypothetical protein [Prevotellaceae bacterium]
MNLIYYFGKGVSRFLFGKTVIVFFVALPLLSLAQDDLTKTVQVTKAYDPIISDAEKIEFPASFNDSLLNIKGKYQYSITPQNIMSQITLRPMPAAKISENEYKDPKWLYAKLGAGYPVQFLGDLYIHNLNPADLSYGLFYNHRSIWTSIDNPNGKNIPIDEMNHQAGVFFRKSWEKVSFNIDGGVNGHNVLFYGYNTTTAKRAALVPNKDSIAQAYTSIYVNAGINSQDTKETKLNYHLNLLFDIFGDNGKNKFNKGRIFSMNENKFGADIELGYAFGEEKKHSISLKADGNMYLSNLDYNTVYNNYFANPLLIYNSVFTDLYGIYGTGKNISNTRYIFNITPSYSFSWEKIDVDLGVKYTGYKRDFNMKNRIYPVANVRFKLIDEFVPYVGVNGETKMNDYKSIATENPFIAPGMNMTMKATNCIYAISSGIRGNIENIIAYNIYGRYSSLNDFYFFVNSSQTLPTSAAGEFVALRNNFDVVYDDVQQLKVGADLKISAGRIEAMLSGAYYSYILDMLSAAFHRPTVVADLDIDIKATKTLVFNINVHANSKTPYTYNVAHSEIYYNDAFINLGIGAEYLFTRSFSIFLNANNLLGNRNEIWHGYKLPGLGVLGGITFKF